MKVTTLKRISLDGFAKLMENDITDKDFQNFKAFAAKATKIMNWIMRYDTKEA